MNEHLADGYSEPCAQCAAVDWGVTDEGQFFCRNCHNIIERTREVVDDSTFLRGHSRISQLARTKKTGKEGARQWMVCEGFQFILKSQADALVSLGVCSQFKTEVMWNFWKRYLQNTGQAFTKNPVSTVRFSIDVTSESEPESIAQSEQSVRSFASSRTGDISASGISSEGELSVCSGSTDASMYVSAKERKSYNLMNMPRTLAICYLALLWVREAITLADLLRLASERRVPYLNVHEDFPEELRLFGRDANIFRVESLPSYSKVRREAVNLAQVMKLPAFPTVCQDCLLHPIPLTVRYLLESNLPDGLFVWVHKVIKQAAMGDESFLTFDPDSKRPVLICYDIQAVAIIIVTLKLLFKLDDRQEWTLPEEAADKKTKKKVFSFERWFKIMQPAFKRIRQKREREEARKQWKSSKPLISDLKNKSVVLKKRRVVEHLQHRFQMLNDSTSKQQSSTATSFSGFQFHWGKDEGSDGSSMHHHRLDCTFKKHGVNRLANRKYWHTYLGPCPSDISKDHFSDIESSLPRIYVWLIDLFSFLLGVRQAQVYDEVLVVERRLLRKTNRPNPPRKKSKK
ncbi:TATA box-binding protein-associated factor RNA polymerase I subunit B isoform X3 [Paramisgurnus dabryanus]|uniref:TATA box-binding protein-associated factor RNA polymerase I subunit B isoform X3 n=1 Tax=Paramisgurnus dabryanus TaxID=90735 RepID=UPI0031F379C2